MESRWWEAGYTCVVYAVCALRVVCVVYAVCALRVVCVVCAVCALRVVCVVCAVYAVGAICATINAGYARSTLHECLVLENVIPKMGVSVDQGVVMSLSSCPIWMTLCMIYFYAHRMSISLCAQSG